MSAVDLTEAVDAAAREHYDSERVNALTDALVGPEWDDVWPELKHAWLEDALPYVTAAAPLIEAQVRAQVAGEIEAERDRASDQLEDTGLVGFRIRALALTVAAYIARGPR